MAVQTARLGSTAAVRRRASTPATPTTPTRVAYAKPSGYDITTTTQTSPTLTLVAGDLLVVAGFGGESTQTMSTPTASAGSVTWTLQQSVLFAGFESLYVWTGAVAASASATVSVTAVAGGNPWTFTVTQWRDHGGVGVSGQAHSSGVPSVTLTCAANSAVQFVNGDWNTVSATTRTYTTVNGSAMTEDTYGQAAGGWYDAFGAYALTVGAAGSETLGMSAPTGQKYSAIGVEILAASSGGGGAAGAVWWANDFETAAPRFIPASGNGSFADATYNYLNQTPTRVTSPAPYKGTYSGRFSIGPAEQRCENILVDSKGVGTTDIFVRGDDFWWGGAVLLDSTMPIPSTGFQVVQQLKNDGQGSPPFSVAIQQNGSNLVVDGGYGFPGDPNPSSNPKQYDVVLAAATTGVWHRLVFHIFCEDGSASGAGAPYGYFEAWYNGVKVTVAPTGSCTKDSSNRYFPDGGTLYPTIDSYLKFGYYRTYGAGSPFTATNYVQWDAIRVGTSYAAVDPDQ